MKLALAIVALASLADALAVGEKDPLQRWYTRAPRNLKRKGTRFDRDIEANRVDYDQLAREECKAGAEAFDEYCHGVTNDKKYADWRNGRDSDGEDHECAHSDEPS